MSGQEPVTPTPQEGDPAGGAQPGSPAPQEGAGQQSDAERIQRELTAARHEAAKHRTELRKAQDDLKKFQDAQLGDAERQQKELEELRGYRSTTSEHVKSLNLQMAVERQARRLGIIDEEAAYALMNKKDITYGDDGVPDGDAVKAALEALVKDKPWLNKPAPAPEQPTPPAAPPLKTGAPGKPATLTAESLRSMKAEEINARWDEVQAALQTGR